MLYDSLSQDKYVIDITDNNGNYPMIEDSRIFGNSDEKIQAKDLYLNFWTEKVHTKQSITFFIKDIEKRTYNLLVRNKN